ncbi:unnamed protein product [Oikopleura dioica]|uniref:Uncharacterized protein n=1 Tax=Oikopleura dioica TaxID=34765 RepID=E4XB95_OIKDI|nr:unnamed protein product [Oikopleura dioica]
MPKSWSTPPVDFEKLIKQTQGQNLIGCLSGPEGYKGLLLEIGTFSESELEQIDKELPTFKEQEDEYKKAAGLWLRSEECQSQEQDEHIKIHVETTCLPIPTETPKMEIRSSPVKVPTPENKPSRAERRIDPELQKLKCGQGGAYRWSMSKQSFNKVVCPFCIRSEDPSKSGINFIRADYWRRHITEVHKKENEIEHSKNLVICLKCYHIGIDKAKDAKESGSGLPDFSSLFFTADQKEEHREKMHKGENITFVSAWEKKEASQSRRKRTSHHSTDKNSHSAAKSSPSPQKSPQVPVQKLVPPPTATSATTQLPSHSHSSHNQKQQQSLRVSSSSQLPSPMQMSPPVAGHRPLGAVQQHQLHRQNSAPAQIHLKQEVKQEPSDPSHQIRLLPSTSSQMHHHQQSHHHQSPQQQQQSSHLHASNMDTGSIQIMPGSGSMNFSPLQRSQSVSLKSPVLKQEIKQEPFQQHQQCLPPQSPQSRPNHNQIRDQRHNQPGTSRQAESSLMEVTQVDSSCLNSVRADPAFNFTINAEHSLNLDIDTSFGDFDIALPQFDQHRSISLRNDQRQHAHHQQQSLMARHLPKAEDGQSQQQIPQILHSPQVQPAQLNAKMHMMNAHHVQHPVNQNNVNVNGHMMQVDQVNPQAHQAPQQQHRPIQVSLQRQLSHDPNNVKQQKSMSHPLQQQMVAKNIQEILVKTEDDQEQRDAEKQRKKERMPKLKCERGEVYVWNARQFYQKIICPMCDDRGGGCKELTVPHFRKHLEQVHTIDEIESVEVCRMCHRDSVVSRLDVFRGLVASKDENDRIAHFKKVHPGKAIPPNEPFISIFSKQRKSPNDDWGLDGAERDPSKVYKYSTKRKKEDSSNKDPTKTQQLPFIPTPQQQQQAHSVVLPSPSFTNH